jgi:hypothetical protein
MNKAILVLAATVLPLLAAPVTEGFIRVSSFPPDAAGRFHLTGPGFDVTGRVDVGLTPWPSSLGNLCADFYGRCSPSATAAGYDIIDGSGTVGGSSFARVVWGYIEDPGGPSFFFINGPDVPIPGPGTFTGTFEFTGALCGVLPPPYGGPAPCVLNLPSLTGTGRVTMVAEDQSGFLAVTEATYTFLTPEPNTFLLCMPAALLIAAARRLFRARTA